MPWEKALEDIEYAKGLAKELGGEERVKRQHSGGRYTVRERIDRMLDAGSFIEAGPMVGAFWRDCKGKRKCNRSPYDRLLDNPVLRADYHAT